PLPAPSAPPPDEEHITDILVVEQLPEPSAPLDEDLATAISISSKQQVLPVGELAVPVVRAPLPSAPLEDDKHVEELAMAIALSQEQLVLLPDERERLKLREEKLRLKEQRQREDTPASAQVEVKFIPQKNPIRASKLFPSPSSIGETIEE